MKKVIFWLLIWIFSLKAVIASQSLEAINKDTKLNQISKIKSFSGFWEIKLSKPFKGLTTLGYKKEIFDAKNGRYLFEYKFLNPPQLTIPIQPTAKGEIMFDKKQITSLDILIGDQLIAQGQIETGNKFRLTIKEINHPNPIYSKIRDLQKYQFDIFLPYLLPYLDLKPSKTYIFKTIDISSLNQQKINTTNIEVKRTSPYTYQLKIKDYHTKLFYNQTNNLTRYETPFYIAQLITDPLKQQQIEESLLTASTKNKKKLQSDNTSQIITGKKINPTLDAAYTSQKSKNETKKQTTKNPNKLSNSALPKMNSFKNLQNLDIKKEIKKASKKYKPKLCPLINK